MITKENAKSLGLEFIGFTSIYNWHKCGGLVAAIHNPRSNIYKEIQLLKAKGEKGGFTLQLEAIGRSAHSKSRIAIYRGTVSAANHGSKFYSDRNAEFFI